LISYSHIVSVLILFIYLNYNAVILFILYVYSIAPHTELMIRIAVRLVPSNSLYPNITFINLLQGGAGILTRQNLLSLMSGTEKA
ncbi:hypothetical protein ACKE77_20625, partial [Yersinia enterocolitica]